ncbi:hypothetical protein P6U16_25650 (plasmid) [Rhizobium sp. 32-5/1]|uniref:alpha/beta fold hydrolase n=1 Tax=Rhizobium sp. 32-5/1 TaxID=3019602 RepID=UPI00240DB9DE|nr:hypothetical protein [Rhizobium sp. 32-5/1]WEZ85464.1 hypothetical protein P6U16_25650 [Rhizobium sp. 32-5/1]
MSSTNPLQGTLFILRLHGKSKTSHFRGRRNASFLAVFRPRLAAAVGESPCQAAVRKSRSPSKLSTTVEKYLSGSVRENCRAIAHYVAIEYSIQSLGRPVNSLGKGTASPFQKDLNVIHARKPNLVLIPGFMCDEDLWREQIGALSPFAHCFVPNLKGAENLEDIAQRVLRSVDGNFASPAFLSAAS